MNADRDAQITRLVALGYSNRDIAKLAKCSHQNIDQIRARLRRAKPLPTCVKISDAERWTQKTLARILLRAIAGMSYQAAALDVIERIRPMPMPVVELHRYGARRRVLAFLDGQADRLREVCGLDKPENVAQSARAD